MTEIEVPLEKVQEDLSHEVLHHSNVPWIGLSALLSAVLAVFAAIAALLAGHHANEAMIEQIRSSDRWAFYQAKSIKSAILETRQELLRAVSKLDGKAMEEVTEKTAAYRQEQGEIEKEARELEKTAAGHLRIHQTFAKAVTFFQVAIALTAISVLTRRRLLLAGSGVFGVVGLVLLLIAFLQN